jgi:DNA-binding NtrC family response regulator
MTTINNNIDITTRIINFSLIQCIEAKILKGFYMSFLFVEDDEDLLEIYKIEAELAFGKERCFFAENGEEALEIFNKERPAIIITDGRMPKMTGIELCKKVKEISPSTFVALVTGHSGLKDESILEDLFDKIFDKPIAFSEIFNELESVTKSLEMN